MRAFLGILGILVTALATLVTTCLCSSSNANTLAPAAVAIARNFALPSAQVQAALADLTLAPHPFGSSRQAELADLLAQRARNSGMTIDRQSFTAQVPNPAALDPAKPAALTLARNGINLYVRNVVVPGAPCVVALASHYDTKIVEGTDYLGANDSGSSSAVLLAQLDYLHHLPHTAKAPNAAKAANLHCDIIGIFFDGEEAYLTGWTDGLIGHPAHMQDNTYGSRAAAKRLTTCQFAGKAAHCLPPDLGGKPLLAVVLMDMIGSPNVQLSRDARSSPELVRFASMTAEALNKKSVYDSTAQPIEDDHVPFAELGISVIDLIDFHHLQAWHRAGDDVKTLSVASMELAGQVALGVAAQAAL